MGHRLRLRSPARHLARLGPFAPWVLALARRLIVPGLHPVGLPDHGTVDRQQGRLLGARQQGVRPDRQIPSSSRAGRFGLVEAGDLGQQGVGRQVERFGDGADDCYRRLMQTSLDLAQVRVGDAGQLGQLPQGELGQLALRSEIGAEAAVGVRALS